jgi:putative OPT family oligopeptide transporter
MSSHPAVSPVVPTKELTPRSIFVSLIVALLIAGSYPYVVLKIGYGPNISVVSAFFGYILLSMIGVITRSRQTRWECNMVQTAGTAAGQAGFMCVVLAALDMLNQKPELHFSLHLTVMQTFVWLALAGMIGVLLSVPMRKHYIDEEDLTFADGTATGEALLVLDQGPKEAGPRVAALGGGMGLSAAVAWLRDGPLRALPGDFALGVHGHALRMGTEISLLSFGGGMIVGGRIALSMGLGMLLSWVIAPPLLVQKGIIADQTYALVLRWVMWPATGLLVSGGLTALLLKWDVMAKTFRNMSAKDATGTDVPIKWVVAGVLVLSVALALVQWLNLGFPLWLSLVSLVLSFLLMLVGIRVLGETNWAPISAMANLMQAVFAVLSPGSMAVNMIGSGMSGSIAGSGEQVMQTFKTGKMLGSSNRNLTIMQLIAIPVGSLAVAVIYPALKAKYGVGGDGLSSPISVKWAGFAELLNQGFSALPRGCFLAMLIAVGLGVVITILEPKHRKFVPSPTGVGIGMLVPGLSVMPMVIGGICQMIWMRAAPKHEDTFNLPLASGFIAGEALLVLVFALIAMFGGH